MIEREPEHHDCAGRESLSMGRREEVGSSQANKVDSLTGHEENHKAEENACHDRMGKVSLGAIHVGHTQNVELLLAAASSGIDREEYGHCDDAASNTHDDHDFEEAKPQITIEGVVSKDMAIGEAFEVGDQAKEIGIGSRRPSSLFKEPLICPGSVYT
jgi:hypothetical protein